MQLRDYQHKAIDEISAKSGQGKSRLCFQLATGGGKTVCFAGLIKRYITRYPDRRVLILVHREELLKQARKTLYEWYGIIAHPVVAGQRSLPEATVYVAMCETANIRLNKKSDYFPQIGLVIVDECHLGSFRKLLLHFPNCLTVGFTATPISATRKQPLKDIYEDIVCGIDIPDLIADRALCPNITYHIKNINRLSLSISKGEFDEKQMGVAYSKPKQVNNTVMGYKKHCLGKKALVFNCNVAHSKIVAEAFVAEGFNAKHLDANSKDRVEVVRWFAETPDAILCNVGILTTGFNEPSVEAVIMNKATMSLPLWLQCTGRGSRPFLGKPKFTIIDLGGNALAHGDWSTSRDWKDIFENPPKPGDNKGVSPIKDCPQCEAIISVNATKCPICGYEFPKEVIADEIPVEFEIFKDVNIPVQAVIEANQDKKPYAALHVIKGRLVIEAKRKGITKLTDPLAAQVNAEYQKKVKEWCRESGKRYNEWHKNVTTEWMNDELKRVYKWEPKPMIVV